MSGTIVQLEDNNLSDPELLGQIREALEGNQKVIELILSENEIKDGAALAALCCGLPKLQRFDVCGSGHPAWLQTDGWTVGWIQFAGERWCGSLVQNHWTARQHDPSVTPRL